MIIYQNGLIALDYNPYTDVLHVELPDVATFGILELEHALEIVVEHVRNYYIKRLLLDSSKVLVEQIDDASYRKVVGQFILSLSKSRLEKLARVNTTVPAYEEKVVEVASEAVVKAGSSFTISTFSDKQEALRWLVI